MPENSIAFLFPHFSHHIISIPFQFKIKPLPHFTQARRRTGVSPRNWHSQLAPPLPPLPLDTPGSGTSLSSFLYSHSSTYVRQCPITYALDFSCCAALTYRLLTRCTLVEVYGVVIDPFLRVLWDDAMTDPAAVHAQTAAGRAGSILFTYSGADP